MISVFLQFLSSEFNVIGMIGVVFVLLAYFLLQIHKLNQDSIMYSFMNLLGANLILFSLFFSWNLASGVIEIIWLLISLFGLSKAIYMRFRMKK
ncbi:CBU_0592 family membrane protein [Coxiella endosymbiont of Amblyomma nuttalli]|uniref:CBU_0592 family membrane protein n=1 Tax=Coxiella endosymbiont of Amblyomma nuttalli TaxID=2749996 RepID=UPI001BA59709|nr:hypothetical protein [Coxiella endosymbiont of Amblyomma nuttalli]QTS83902.1 hypothetical protein CEAn_00380 [Coxiella endosymbiont of Amblyomma nuttalli]